MMDNNVHCCTCLGSWKRRWTVAASNTRSSSGRSYSSSTSAVVQSWRTAPSSNGIEPGGGLGSAEVPCARAPRAAPAAARAGLTRPATSAGREASAAATAPRRRAAERSIFLGVSSVRGEGGHAGGATADASAPVAPARADRPPLTHSLSTKSAFRGIGVDRRWPELLGLLRV